MNPPRLSVHMLVRDGARVVERALRPLRGIADEICIVDTGSTDGTPDVVRKICADLGMSFSGIAVSPVSRPDLYFPDVPETYHPHVVPERATGSVTGPSLEPVALLRDWAAARNLGLGQCRGRYVMKLDADDEFMTPENILPTINRLDQSPNIDLVACPYEVMDGKGSTDHVTMYTRLWRNKPEICFREVCHENVDWCRRQDGSNWIMTNEALYLRDRRDASGSSRVPHRNLKTFLVEYLARRHLEEPGQRVSDHVLFYLADEAAEVMPTLALRVLDELQLDHLTDAAWATFVRARSFEHMGLFTDADYYYRRATGLGWERARLRHALMLAGRGEEGWRTLLELAIDSNEGHFYPRYASVAEIARAREILSRRRSR